MRVINKAEYDFLDNLFSQTELSNSSVDLTTTLRVEPLKDGGMGSLRFHHREVIDKNRQFGRAIIEGEFYDHDGTLVSFTVNVDEHGQLYELDLWKVDFSSIEKKFPQIGEVKNFRWFPNFAKPTPSKPCHNKRNREPGSN